MQDPLCSLSEFETLSKGPRCSMDQMRENGGAGRGRDLCLLWGAVEALGLGLEDEIISFHKISSRSAFQKVFLQFFPSAEHSLASPSLGVIQWFEPCVLPAQIAAIVPMHTHARGTISGGSSSSR